MSEQKYDAKDTADGIYYTALDIARWFIDRNQQDVEEGLDEKMTLLKLLKLLYYAEGCSLALRGRSLFQEKILAWEHGPVVEEVWRSFSNAYDLQVDEKDMDASLKKFCKADAELLEDVYAVFGKYSASGLRNKTHEESPWLDATQHGRIFNAEIPRCAIKKYFEENYVEED